MTAFATAEEACAWSWMLAILREIREGRCPWPGHSILIIAGRPPQLIRVRVLVTLVRDTTSNLPQHGAMHLMKTLLPQHGAMHLVKKLGIGRQTPKVLNRERERERENVRKGGREGGREGGRV
jgi:hypothetical protein